MSYLPLIETVATTATRANASTVDSDGVFPTATLEAMGPLMGLISATEVGGMGQGPRAAVDVVTRLAQECASSAMVVCMHYAGTAVIEAHGSDAVRRDIAAAKHLTTLAFSEAGSRSHFWAPLSSATRQGDNVRLDAKKSWCTSAHHADSYVWSSQPTDADGELSTLWLVPRRTDGLSGPAAFNGLGLRGNDSTPIVADGVIIPSGNRLGEDGGGFGIMMQTVLPMFNAMVAATSVGVMNAAIAGTVAHVSGTRHMHLDSALRDLPTIRNYVARMKCQADMASTLLYDTVAAMESGREDTMLRVLQCKAVCAESALDVTQTAMRVCGGAAYRKDVGVERAFRDSQAASVMGPTTDVLYDFIGKAVTGMELF